MPATLTGLPRAGKGARMPESVLMMIGLALCAAGALVVVSVVAWMLASRRVSARIAEDVAQRTRQMEQVGRRFKLMVENGWDLTVVLDATGTVDYANSAWIRLLGAARSGLSNKPLLDVVHPRDHDACMELVQEGLQGGAPEPVVLRLQHSDGHWVFVEAVARGLPDVDWKIRQVVLHARDISGRRKALEDLARSEQRFRDFAASSADWLWETDPRLAFTYISPGVMNVMGYDPGELQGMNLLKGLFVEGEDDPARDLIESRVQRQQAWREIEFWTQTKQGERVCLRLSGVPVFDEQQLLLGYRGVASNVTASKLDRENTYRLATTDHLTGLLNRHRFREELTRAIALSRRHHTNGVLVFIDLDRFKEVNDTHGHEAGDKILLGVADILREAVRSTDVVARLGGDEFAIIMHNIAVEQASEKVQYIIERISSLVILYNNSKLAVTMSAGMIPYPQDDRDAEQLLMSADLAMYRAKDMGRNRMYVDVVDAGGERRGSVQAQLQGLERLKEVLETADFQLHYQAIVSAQHRQRPLFEALLRITDADGKFMPPPVFIEAAEHFGLIQQLDLAVIERVFQTQQDLMKDDVEVDVSINLSSRSLGDPEVMEALKQLMTDYAVAPNRIVLEVTETMALHDPAQMRDVGEIHKFITELRALGFRFALDDFGTGFTSFRYLKVLDVDVVKIDGEYVKDLLTSDEDRLFVKTMCELCRGLGIQTVAEFVENEAVMDVLIELGVDYGQGWHFAKPGPDLAGLTQTFTGRIMGDFRGDKGEIEAKLKELVKPSGKELKAGKGETSKPKGMLTKLRGGKKKPAVAANG